MFIRNLEKQEKVFERFEKLNEYGKQGWRLISGTDDWKYSIFEREIEDHGQG